ncbi:hypothetical protein GCM10022220_24670 [Actinocatenispora rupis]|uniref:PPIase cyclophilin-type domain-containing protein n=2 Tax=Actinocatenispora rupis TaxID=519421 RepID=A0A8J3JHX2_9ACTN|nr:hypothetical protein Aru02nite_61620 [Actinocatenispora rupis]
MQDKAKSVTGGQVVRRRPERYGGDGTTGTVPGMHPSEPSGQQPPWDTPPPGVPPKRAWIGWLVGACAVVLVLCCGGGGLLAYHHWSAGRSAAGSPSGSGAPHGSAAAGACRYRSDGHKPARAVSPPDPTSALPTTAVLTTNRGTITIRLAADKAPCTVRSLASLAKQKFYDGSPCHRLTTRALWVLQCGDPSGTGSGGPGYTVPDENLPTGATHPYPRGTVAMANTGSPGSGGSQFFICYQDDTIPPSYAVLGTVTGGLSVVDKVAAAGVDGPNGDGEPKLPVTITTFTTR